MKMSPLQNLVSTAKRKIKENFLQIILILLPVFIIAGLIDYRFNNYFWPGWNAWRLLSKCCMFDFWSLFDWFLIFVIITYIISIIKSDKNRPDYKFRWIYIPIFLIGLGIAASKFAYSPIEPQIKSFYGQILTNYANPIIIFFILVFALKERAWKEKFEKSILISFGILGLFSLFDYFTNALPGANKDFLGRLVWPYIDPFFDLKAESANWLSYIFGPMAILAGIEFLIQLKNKKSIRNRWFEISAFLISFSVLLLTKSYAGILITFLILSLWILINLPKKWRLYFLIILFIVAALGIASQYNTRKFQILLGNYKKENSIERRIQIYKFNTKAFLEKPLTGIGPGNYQSYFRKKMQKFLGASIPEEEIPPHPHNLIFYFWSELGIFGLFAILIIYITPIIKLSKNSKNAGYFALLYFLGHGLIDVPYGLSEISILLWIIIAFCFIEDIIQPHGTTPLQKRI